MQEGKRDKAPRQKGYGLYSKLFHLFGLVDYFRRAALEATKTVHLPEVDRTNDVYNVQIPHSQKQKLGVLSGFVTK